MPGPTGTATPRRKRPGMRNEKALKGQGMGRRMNSVDLTPRPPSLIRALRSQGRGSRLLNAES